MRILHLSSERSWRGGEQQISYLVEVLRSRGVRCEIAARENSAMAERHPESLPLPFRGEWDLYTAYRIRQIVREKNIDLVHAHTGHGHTLAVLAASLGMRAPVVVSKRTDYPVRDNAFSRWKFNHSAIKAFLCVSDKIRQILARDLARPELAQTVYSGINLQRFPEAPAQDIRSLLGLPAEARVVISTGALAEQKDIPTLLAVAAKLVPHHPDLHFALCGDGPLATEMKKLAATLGVSSRVHFLGFRSDLPSFLGSADCFLITSKDEGLGTSIIDAFAVGLPVVATAAGGIPELVRHAQTGLLAQVGDVDMLATHTENMVYIAGGLKSELLHNAQKKAQEFSYIQTASKTLEVYQKILSHP